MAAANKHEMQYGHHLASCMGLLVRVHMQTNKRNWQLTLCTQQILKAQYLQCGQ